MAKFGEIIYADKVLAFLLRKREFISYKNIIRFKEKVSQEDPHIMLQIHGDAVDQAIGWYPEIFRRREKGPEKGIERAERARDYLESDYIESCFINESNITKKTRKVMESVLEGMSL